MNNKQEILMALRAAGFNIEIQHVDLILRLIEAVNDNPEGVTLKDVSRIEVEVREEYNKETE